MLLKVYSVIQESWTLRASFRDVAARPAYILKDVDSGDTDETAKEGNRYVQEQQQEGQSSRILSQPGSAHAACSEAACTCVSACARACVYARVSVCLYVCAYVYTHIYTYT